MPFFSPALDVAKNPEKFGISLIETKDADVRRTVAYRTRQDRE
jgi:hypothetical protein